MITCPEVPDTVKVETVCVVAAVNFIVCALALLSSLKSAKVLSPDRMYVPVPVLGASHILPNVPPPPANVLLLDDVSVNLIVEVPFTVHLMLEIDNIKEYGGFSYPVQKTRWVHEGFVNITDKDVQHPILDTIIFPNILLPARKSNLTSEQTYQIIRKHIQDNIEPKYAHITSDYDFCFTVKKKIHLAQKIPYQKNIARYGARKPKYVTDYRESREIEVFEMTHSGHNYGKGYNNYTIIEGFKGHNVEQLKENIDNYLKDLMDLINCPLIDCPNCKGKGVLENK